MVCTRVQNGHLRSNVGADKADRSVQVLTLENSPKLMFIFFNMVKTEHGHEHNDLGG